MRRLGVLPVDAPTAVALRVNRPSVPNGPPQHLVISKVAEDTHPVTPHQVQLPQEHVLHRVSHPTSEAAACPPRLDSGGFDGASTAAGRRCVPPILVVPRSREGHTMDVQAPPAARSRRRLAMWVGIAVIAVLLLLFSPVVALLWFAPPPDLGERQIAALTSPDGRRTLLVTDTAMERHRFARLTVTTSGQEAAPVGCLDGENPINAYASARWLDDDTIEVELQDGRTLRSLWNDGYWSPPVFSGQPC